MFPRETAPEFRPGPWRATRLRPARYPLDCRDPRQFGQARPWLDDITPAVESEPSSDLRLFAHSFAVFFLFFSLLIA